MDSAAASLHDFPFLNRARALAPDLVRIRRDLHSHPELAFQETRTAQKIAGELKNLGFSEIRTGLAETGLIADLGLPHGPTVALRADMDALPITEAIDRPYRSAVEGVMHACGHDGHTAALLGVARLLAARRRELKGCVKFIFQPAEEAASGAEEMIKEGVMRDPSVDAVLAIHLWNYLPVGSVGFRVGPVFASVDDIRITIKGRGGHGGLPHQTIDPIPVAAQTILGIQHLVSRNVSPFEPAVVTVGMVQGGTTFNVIPDTVSLAGTIRAYSMEVRDYLVRRVEETVQGICLAAGAQYDFNVRFCCPPVVNDERMTMLAREAAEEALGRERVVTVEQTTTGDDVAYFNQVAPGCYFLIGSGNPQKGLDRPHHHREFDFDEEALPVAVRILTSAAIRVLESAGASERAESAPRSHQAE